MTVQGTVHPGTVYRESAGTNIIRGLKSPELDGQLAESAILRNPTSCARARV
jgi:hypothetical protein